MQVIQYFKELVETRISPKIKFILVGALARNEVVNVTQISLLVQDKDLKEMIDNVPKLTT